MDGDFALEKDIFLKEIAFIQKKHEGQFRRSSMAPYYIHPVRVAILVMKYKKSHKIDELVLASLDHDLLEETDTLTKEIEERSGALVVSLVIELTNNKEEIRKIGKTEYMKKKLLELSSWGLTIKLCDRFDNISDLYFVEESFKNKYIKETEIILEHLIKNRVLSETQSRIVDDIFKLISFIKSV